VASSDDLQELLAYLRMLSAHAPGGQALELRRPKSDERRQFFLPICRIPTWAPMVLDAGQADDVYIGVVPRVRRGGTRADAGESSVIWADCDEPASMEALRTFSPAPTMVVLSGRGRHAYWSTTEPVSPDDLERSNRRLALALGSDPQVFDAARILRPPGTLNLKAKVPRQVRLESFEPRTHGVLDVVGDLPDPTPVRLAPAIRSLPAGDDPLLAVPAEEYIERLLGVAIGRDRKVPCPFHPDRTPSLHVYAGDRGWACFGCRKGGTIIDLGAALYGFQPRGRGYHKIRRQLAADLGLVAA
jgi:hypothetical protein